MFSFALLIFMCFLFVYWSLCCIVFLCWFLERKVIDLSPFLSFFFFVLFESYFVFFCSRFVSSLYYLVAASFFGLSSYLLRVHSLHLFLFLFVSFCLEFCFHSSSFCPSCFVIGCLPCFVFLCSFSFIHSFCVSLRFVLFALLLLSLSLSFCFVPLCIVCVSFRFLL